jgi:DNA polymerase I-like protein with 3'-5' exonuclease and polymerase domains
LVPMVGILMAVFYFGDLPPGDSRRREVYERLWKSPPAICSIDVETVSIADRTPLGFAIALPDNNSFYFDMWEQGVPWHSFLPSSIEKVYQNAPFDVGYDCLGMYGADIDNIHDTVILTRHLNIDTELSLVSEDVYNTTWGMGTYFEYYGVKRVLDLPKEALAEKCCRDALVTLDAWFKYRPLVSDAYYNKERKFMISLLHMGKRGVKLDQERLKAIDKELETDLDLYLGYCSALGFNPNSGEQVAYILSTQGIQIPYKRGKSKPTVDDWFLSSINHPWAAMTRVARRYNKLHGTYSHKWLGQDRVRSHYRSDALSGRVKSAGDNFQNIPTGAKPLDIVPKAGPIRSVFVPDDEGPQFYNGVDPAMHDALCSCGNPMQPHFTKFDDSQIELRCFAYMAEDEEMQFFLNYVRDHPNEPAPPDFHTETQRAIGAPTRRQSKVMVFGGLLYGGSDNIIMKNTGIRNLKAIQYARAAFNYRWPKSAAYIERAQQEALRTMEVVTLQGNVIRLDRSRQALTDKHVMNMGVAIPAQASAAEIVKDQFNFLVAEKYVPIDLLSTMIHDEGWINGVFELPSNEMANMSSLWTPIEWKLMTRGNQGG